MKILALEFSSSARSVAVLDAAGAPASDAAPATVQGRATQQAGVSTRAFALIGAALQEAGIDREQVEVLAIGLGPGSYTGIRIAIAIAQGWQLARPIKVLGLNSVEVLAWQAWHSGRHGPATLLLDAQRGEFYVARYELAPPAPRLLDPLRLLGRDELNLRPGETLVVEPELLKAFPAALAMCPEAAMLGMLAVGRKDCVTADQLEPVYLRPTSFVKAPPPRVLPPLPSS